MKRILTSVALILPTLSIYAYAADDAQPKPVLGSAAVSNGTNTNNAQILGFSVGKDSSPYELHFLWSMNPRRTLSQDDAANPIGTALLAPDKDSKMWQVRYRQEIKRNYIPVLGLLNSLDFYGRYATTQYTFNANNDSTKADSRTQVDGNVTTIVAGLLWSHKATEETDMTYGLFGGITHRNISGNLTLPNSSEALNNVSRSKTSFTSPEIGAFVRKGGLILSATRTNFGGSVASFSRNQVTIAVETIVTVGK